MTTTTHTHPHPSRQGEFDLDQRTLALGTGAPDYLRGIAHAAHTLATWLNRSRQRHSLATLDEHLLRDIGVTRGQALRESQKAFWEA